MAPAASKSRTRSSALWTLCRFGLSVFLISLIISLLALPWTDLSWWKVFRRCASIGAVISLVVFIKRIERRSFSSYGLLPHGAGKRHFLFGLALGLLGLAFMLGLGLLTGACRLDLTPDTARLWSTILGFIPAAVMVGILEELVFRGFILQHLLALSQPVAVIGSSALYAIVHLKITEITMHTWLELGGLFLLGAVLAISYLLTRQLALSIGLHAVLAYGARVNKLLLEFTNQDLSWLVGTSRLVNGIASWIAIAGIGGMIVWWARRSQPQGGVGHEQVV